VNKNQDHRIRGEELFLPLLSISFSLLYLSQVWEEPRVVVLWPYLIMILLIACSLMLVIKGLAKGERRGKEEVRPLGGVLSRIKGGAKPLLISGATVAYLAGVNHLGFSSANLLYLIILIRSLGTRRAGVLVGLSLGITALLHLVMIDFLQMPVPRLPIPWTDWQI
jgi:hypothetical protein